MKHEIERKDIIIALLLMAGSAVYYRVYYDYGVYLLDEGYLVDAAVRIMGGQIPYLDFQNVYSPGRYYLFAGLFKLLGMDHLYIRTAWLLFHAFGTGLAYLLMRRLGIGMLYGIAAAILVALMPGPWHKSFFEVGPLVCLWFYFNYIEKPGKSAAFIAGLVTGALFLFRQDVAAYGSVAIGTAMLFMGGVRTMGRFKEMVLFGLAVILAILPMFGWFYFNGALSPMFSQVFMGGKAAQSGMNLPFPGFFPLWRGTISQSVMLKLYYLPFLVYIPALFISVRGSLAGGEKGRRALMFLCLSVFGSLTVFQLMSRSGLGHLWQVLPLVYITSYAFLWKLSSQSAAWRPARFVASALGVVLIAMVSLAGLTSPSSGSVAMIKYNTMRLPFPQARLYVTQAMYEQLIGVAGYIREKAGPGSYILALPDIGMLYFLTETRNPSYFSVYYPGQFGGEGDQKRVIAAMKEKDIRFVVYDNDAADYQYPERRLPNHARLLWGFITDNYRPVEQFGGLTVLERNR